MDPMGYVLSFLPGFGSEIAYRWTANPGDGRAPTSQPEAMFPTCQQYQQPNPYKYCSIEIGTMHSNPLKKSI